jgi:predicted ATPase
MRRREFITLISVATACWPELSPITDPRLLAPAVVSTFGLPIQSGDPIPRLVGHLRSQQQGASRERFE